jgi:hypothetical protein
MTFVRFSMLGVVVGAAMSLFVTSVPAVAQQDSARFEGDLSRSSIATVVRKSSQVVLARVSKVTSEPSKHVALVYSRIVFESPGESLLPSGAKLPADVLMAAPLPFTDEELSGSTVMLFLSTANSDLTRPTALGRHGFFVVDQQKWPDGKIRATVRSGARGNNLWNDLEFVYTNGGIRKTFAQEIRRIDEFKSLKDADLDARLHDWVKGPDKHELARLDLFKALVRTLWSATH